MTKFSNRLNPVFNHALLREIDTPFGTRAFYDSVSFCNRCGCCRQNCPSYKIFLQEPFSPRGRNQFVRLIIEGKLHLDKKDKQAHHIINSCSLCGKCSASCAGQIPTAEHILQMRRALNKRVLPFALHSLLVMRRKRPQLFKFLLKVGLFTRNLGFLKGLHALYLLPDWLAHANDILPKKITDLPTALAQGKINTDAPKNPSLIYLPSFEVSYFSPQTAAQILRTLLPKHTPVVWHDTPSGLFSYLYQNDVRLSRLQLRRLIKRHAQTGNGNLPLLTDSIDVYLFLKNAPQLFATGSHARRRAENFASCVKFASEFLSPEKNKKYDKIMLDNSALLWRQDPVFEQTSKILIDAFGKNFVECDYIGLSIAAGGYSFVNIPLALEMGLLCVRRYAQNQTADVVTLSVLAQMELSFLLRTFYPHAKAHYIMQL
jgi:glycolate oxidase iron-sulfur subunit